MSVILWGPPGTGKTTLAQAIARSSGRKFVELSAVTAGVRDVRQVMEEARASRDLYGLSTVLFLDEIHRFTKAQQDALLPGVENGWVILVAATTENPSFSVISPLLSRSLLLTLELLTDDDLGMLVDRAVADPRGLAGGVELDPEARAAIIRLASGDARRALTALEAASVAAAQVAAAEARTAGDAAADADDDADEASDDDETTESEADAAAAPKPVVTAEVVARAVDRALLRYDRNGDEHYDVISAFIKSVRGSDVDAALHYLARMIEAGEDPRFIARRIIVLASEDIGMADPHGARRRRGRGRRRAVHRHARGAHPAGAGGRAPRDRAEVERRVPRHRPRDRRRARGPGRAGAEAPARRALPGREAARPRQGLRLSARRPDRRGRAGVPARPSCAARPTTSPPSTATSARCRPGSRSCGASCGAAADLRSAGARPGGRRRGSVISFPLA